MTQYRKTVAKNISATLALKEKKHYNSLKTYLRQAGIEPQSYARQTTALAMNHPPPMYTSFACYNPSPLSHQLIYNTRAGDPTAI